MTCFSSNVSFFVLSRVLVLASFETKIEKYIDYYKKLGTTLVGCKSKASIENDLSYRRIEIPVAALLLVDCVPNLNPCDWVLLAVDAPNLNPEV